MKNPRAFLPLLTIFFAVLSAIYIYKYYVCSSRIDSDIPTSTSLCQTTCSNNFVYDETEGVEISTVKTLVDNYANNQLAWIKAGSITNGSSPDIIDAQSAWFSLDKLKSFIYDIETQSCAQCDTCNKMLGIRIYYGAYSGAPTGTDLSGLHTVVMVPTYFDNPNNIDFSPSLMTECTPTDLQSSICNSDGNSGVMRQRSQNGISNKKILALIAGYDGEASIAPDSLKKQNNQLRTTAANVPIGPVILNPDEIKSLMNHGDLCPPPFRSNTPSVGAGNNTLPYGNALFLNPCNQ